MLHLPKTPTYGSKLYFTNLFSDANLRKIDLFCKAWRNHATFKDRIEVQPWRGCWYLNWYIFYKIYELKVRWSHIWLCIHIHIPLCTKWKGRVIMLCVIVSYQGRDFDSYPVSTNTAMRRFPTRMTCAVVSIWSIVYFQSVETLRYQESAIARLYSREGKREFSKERNIQRFANSLLQSHSRLEE